MPHFNRNAVVVYLVLSGSLWVQVDGLIAGDIAINVTPTSDLGRRHNLSLRSRQVIKISEVYCDAKLVECFELIAVAIVRVIEAPEVATVDFTSLGVQAAREVLIRLPLVKVKCQPDCVRKWVIVQARGLLVCFVKRACHGRILTIPKRTNTVAVSRSRSFLENGWTKDALFHGLGPEVALLVVVNGSDGVLEIRLLLGCRVGIITLGPILV